MSAEEKNSDEIKEWKEKLELLRDVENFKTKVRKSTSIEDIEEYLNEEWKNTEMTKQEKQLSLRQISVKVLRDYMASIDWENQTDREIAEFKVAMHHLNRTWYDLLKAERKLKDIPYYLSDKKKKKKREKRLDEVRFAKWCLFAVVIGEYAFLTWFECSFWAAVS